MAEVKYLKIKNNVDLKNLKKLGFKYDDYTGQYKFCERNIEGSTYIYINTWNRRVLYRQEKNYDTSCLLKLYDLIKADLIEPYFIEPNLEERCYE